MQTRDVKRSLNIRTSKKLFEFEFVFDPLKFDFQIPTGLNSAKSILWLHKTAVTNAWRYKLVKVRNVPT